MPEIFLEPAWQLFLAADKYVGNDVAFGVLIQQFFHVVYIAISTLWTILYIRYNCKDRKQHESLHLNFILKWLGINTFVLIGVAAIPPALGLKAEWPAHAPTVPEFFRQMFWELVWYDFFFYVFHYIFHRLRFFYTIVHSVHHKCNPVVAVHSQTMHPVELLLLSLPAVVPGVALQYHPLSYLTFQLCLVIYGSFVHGHFDYNIEKYTFGIMTGSITHGRHHTACDTNYGGFTTIMDRVMGTYTFARKNAKQNNTPLDRAFRVIDRALGRRQEDTDFELDADKAAKKAA